MMRYSRLVPAAAIGLLLGCDGVLNFFNPPTTETGSSKLLSFSSQEEFANYFKQQVGDRNSTLEDVSRGPALDGAETSTTDSVGANPPTAIGADGDAGGSFGAGDDHSTTTIQEEGVDESDVVKTDGTYLYLIEYGNDGNQLRIVKAHPTSEVRSSAVVPLDGWGQDLYLYGNRVIALTSTGGGFYFFGEGIADGTVAVEIKPLEAETDASASEAESEANSQPEDSASSSEVASGGATGDDGVADVSGGDDGVSSDDVDASTDLIAPDIGVYRYERPRTVVTVIDVSDPTAPSVLSRTFFDGSQSSSRMIDGVLHLVLANYQNYFFDVIPLLGRPDFAAETVDPTTVLPRYTRIGSDGATTEGDAVTWENLYHPTDPDGFGVVYVASVDVDDDASFSAVGVVAEPGLIYSSRNALYLTDTNYDFSGNLRETTDVYKFAYAGRGATPTSTGTIPGRILNQYSMSEYRHADQKDYLRVASTVGPTFSFIDGQTLSQSSNNVYVLGETEGTLNVTGRVENLAPGETIQAARFLGGRGYVVTFLQTDPLFILDLSEPTAPQLLGELKVPDFSTFLVPMDENHLLAVGQHVAETGTFGPGGVQLSIFDVTNPAQPALMDKVVIGDEGDGAYSEALYNPKAFTYFASRGLVALPISLYDFQTFVDPGFPTDAAVGVDEDNSAGMTDGTVSGGDDGVSTDATPDGTEEVRPDDSTITTTEPYVPPGFDGLFVYSATVDGGFEELGRISTRFEKEGYYWNSFTRGVFMGDDVLAVTDHGLRASAVADVSSPTVELVWAEPLDLSPPVAIEGELTIDDSLTSDSDVSSGGGSSPSSGAAASVIR